MAYVRRRKKPDVEKELKKCHCPDCKHAIFDEQWGEWKCKYHGIRIYDTKVLACEEYEKNYNAANKAKAFKELCDM